MKKILLCAVLLFAATFSNGQYGEKAITLTGDNVQLKAGKIHDHSASISNKVKPPSTGAKATWDYSGLSGGSAITSTYLKNDGKNKNKAFSDDAVLLPGINEPFDASEEDGYPTTNVYDEDNKGMFFAGLNTPRFPKWLGAPNSTLDTLAILKQASLPSNRVNVIKFPATSGSKWSSTTSLTTNFNVTIVELGWSNVTATEVQYTTVSDAVVGYGDLKIPTTKKNNKQNEFDALMVKHSVNTFDSIFVSPIAVDGLLYTFYGPNDGTGDGIPASTVTNLNWIGWPLGYPTSQHIVDQYVHCKKYGQNFVDAYVGAIAAAYGYPVEWISPVDPYGLLAANGTAEGMVTVNDNSEIFYTTKSFRPAITFDFGTDNTYSTLASIVYNTDITGDDNDDDNGCKSVQLTNNKFGHPGAGGLGGSNGQTIPEINSTSQLSVYPNPLVNSSSMNCSMLKNSDATWTISIMNITGQVVQTIPVSAKGHLNIPVSLNENMKSGLYIVNVSDETGQRVGLSKVNVLTGAN